ncbi:hypothetical protein FNV43_RR06045 [Rhamnella rubrinervis]|uniref:Uncharacterized protein n=1 Tax=Rhamnella rubrinervis TaxID=2594499 RepID=A0A8K0HCQ9_9ROSA|nr:hypothetical protein FNV43_RR06045 [Rhamnella rubrinervis]
MDQQPQEHQEQHRQASPSAGPSQPDPPSPLPPTPPPPPFDPSRMIGIIKRKALIKELAAAYHAECLAYCQELLELQRKWDEIDLSKFVLCLGFTQISR